MSNYVVIPYSSVNTSSTTDEIVVAWEKAAPFYTNTNNGTVTRLFTRNQNIVLRLAGFLGDNPTYSYVIMAQTQTAESVEYVEIKRTLNNVYSIGNSHTSTLSVSYGTDYLYTSQRFGIVYYVSDYPIYSNLETTLAALAGPIDNMYPITYRLTNCTAPSAPAEAAVGDTVNVPLVMQQGYDIVTPSTDIVVTNNGVAVPHTYSNGTISFTMPDPS